MGAIPDAERDRVLVKGVVRKVGEVFGVAEVERNLGSCGGGVLVGSAYARSFHDPCGVCAVETAPRVEAKHCESQSSLAERTEERTVVVHSLGEALLSFLEHLRVDVEHGDARVPVTVFGTGVIEDAHRNVSRAACDVEAL